MRQSAGESAEDIAVKLRELYNLINNTDESTMKHTFLDAIDPSVAREVEAGCNVYEKSLDELVAAASQLESVNMKYGHAAVASGARGSASVVSAGSAVGSSTSVHSEMSSNTIGDLLKEFRELKISLVNSSGRAPSAGAFRNPGPTRVFNCLSVARKGIRNLIVRSCLLLLVLLLVCVLLEVMLSPFLTREKI